VDLTFTPEQELLRQEVRTWLEQNLPPVARPSSTSDEAKAFDLEWQQTLYRGGWAGISWPVEYGGRGLDTLEQLIFLQEYASAGAPDEGFRFNGLNLGGPTIIAYGNEQQKAQYLPPILRGETIWCQGFSEPGAGSDLAAIRTRGVVDGDELVISGQKIWTSYARFADYQQVLVRTDAEQLRHRGISWVICKMDSPGITIRPIGDMAGGDDLHEVFYDEVRVPLANIVGGINNGWKIAMGQLGFERGTAFMTLQIELTRVVEDLIEMAKTTTVDSGGFAIEDDEYARALGKLRVEARALQAMTLMAVSRIERSGSPGAEGSMLKLYYSDLIKRVGSTAVKILGMSRLNMSVKSGRWPHWLLWSFGVALGGGTSEIQRNIIGERLLGLPR
jgi:alkylation response protein AidB-like acyl-CoA dehydrogenase